MRMVMSFPSSGRCAAAFSRKQEKGRALPMIKQSFGDEGSGFPSPVYGRGWRAKLAG
jgi:hypothetical protein